MNRKFKIALIIPYFGKWPQWTPLFLHSCKENSDMDFHIFTDSNLRVCDVGSNIILHTIDFKDYCAIASNVLGINFTPENPYKICDLRPFFGIVHHDLLASGNYTFWGYGDVDLIWGRIRHFYTDDLLSHYDMLSSHSDRLSGHFCMVRNNDRCNRLCFSIKKWQDKLSDCRHYALDEQDFTLTVWPKAKWFWKLHTKVFFKLPLNDEWNSYVRFCTKFGRWLGKPNNILFREMYTTPFSSCDDNRVLYTYDGICVMDSIRKKEVPYVHFYSIKKNWGNLSQLPAAPNNYHNVEIRRNGIYYKI